METILITGGAGFIGSHLVNELSGQNRVVVIDDLSMGNLSNIEQNENVTFIKGDIGDENLINEVFSKYSFDYIFHLAAIASVADSVARPVETNATNFIATLKLLEAAKKQKETVNRFVFASSAAVYGDEPTLPKREVSTIKPLTPYAIDKFAAERYVLAYDHLYGLKTSAVRFFNVYGINQNPNSPYSGVLSILTDVFKKLYQKEDVSFKVFGDGEQTRDFVNVKDVVQALQIVSKHEESRNNVYNVGTGTPTSLNDIIKIYEEITGIDLPTQYLPAREGDIKESYSDITALRSLGYSSNYDLQRGLKIYWENELKLISK